MLGTFSATQSRLQSPPIFFHLFASRSLLYPPGLIIFKMASLLGADYNSSDDESLSNPSKPQAATPATEIVAAPEVNTEVWSLELFQSRHISELQYLTSQ